MSLLRRISVGKKQEENFVAPEKPVKPEGWSEAEFFVWQFGMRCEKAEPGFFKDGNNIGIRKIAKLIAGLGAQLIMGEDEYKMKDMDWGVFISEYKRLRDLKNTGE